MYTGGGIGVGTAAAHVVEVDIGGVAVSNGQGGLGITTLCVGGVWGVGGDGRSGVEGSRQCMMMCVEEGGDKEEGGMEQKQLKQ